MFMTVNESCAESVDNGKHDVYDRVMNTNAQAIIDGLRERQGDGSLRGFAQRLGVSPATWSLIRSGKRPVNAWFAAKALTAFPDLAPQCLAFFQASK